MANGESFDNCIKLSHGLLEERLVKVEMESKTVTNAGLSYESFMANQWTAV